MATLSELHFRIAETDWSEDGQADAAREKTKRMLDAGCTISEFGTRRRRSYFIQDLVVSEMVGVQKEHAGKGGVLGTSNVRTAAPLPPASSYSQITGPSRAQV